MFADMQLILAQEDAPPVGADEPVSAPTQGAGPGEAITSQNGSANGNGTPQPKPFGFGSFLPLILIFAVFWFVLMGGQRKEKKKRASMLASLSKGDKVQTVGGILGTVVEVRDHDIVVKVDENANIRLRFSRSSIQSVLSEDE